MSLKIPRLIAGSNIPASGPLPVPTTKTGTIVTLGTIVTGTGTKFTTELVRGQYLYHTAANQIRKIVGISTDSILVIEAPFTTELAGQAVIMTQSQFTAVAITATGAGTKDGVAIAINQFLSLSSDSGVVPFTYSGALTFDVGYFE